MATSNPFRNDQHMNNESGKESTTFRNKQATPAPTTIVILSANPSVIDTVGRSVPSNAHVVEAASVDAAMQQIYAVRPGVVLIDTMSCKDVSGTIAQMMQELPNLAVVVACKSDENSAMMKLVATGQVFRFLITPLSQVQTKMTIDAAISQHHDLGMHADRREANASDDGGEARKSYLPAYIGLGAALVVIVGGIFYGISHMGNESPQSMPVVANESPAAKELALADKALADGKLLEPPGDSALDLYRSALTIDPKNARAKAGIDNVANKLLEKAEAALSAEQLETAVTILEQARDVSPDNARLKFLDGQVARERERLKLTQAQDTSKKVRSLLAQAQTDMDAGRLFSPSGNNARDDIAEARRTDPTDPEIAQAQRTLNARVVEAARRAAEQGQNEQAQSLLSVARQMGAAGSDVSAVERTLTAAETRAAAAEKQQQPSAAQQAAIAAAQQQAAAEAARKKAEAEAAAAAAAAAAAQVIPPKRIKTVPPAMPKEAADRGISGYVVVSYTIKQNGLVGDVKVDEAQPKGVFDAAAMQAVSQWRYEPPKHADGKPATLTDQKIKLKFDN